MSHLIGKHYEVLIEEDRRCSNPVILGSLVKPIRHQEESLRTLNAVLSVRTRISDFGRRLGLR